MCTSNTQQRNVSSILIRFFNSSTDAGHPEMDVHTNAGLASGVAQGKYISRRFRLIQVSPLVVKYGVHCWGRVRWALRKDRPCKIDRRGAGHSLFRLAGALVRCVPCRYSCSERVLNMFKFSRALVPRYCYPTRCYNQSSHSTICRLPTPTKTLPHTDLAFPFGCLKR